MIILSHIADALRGKPLRRGWLFYRTERPCPRPVLRTPTWALFRQACVALGLPPVDVFEGRVSLHRAPAPTLLIGAKFLDVVLENARQYNLLQMNASERRAFISLVAWEFFHEAGARLDAPRREA